jgi:hypothetical protein
MDSERVCSYIHCTTWNVPRCLSRHEGCAERYSALPVHAFILWLNSARDRHVLTRNPAAHARQMHVSAILNHAQGT